MKITEIKHVNNRNVTNNTNTSNVTYTDIKNNNNNKTKNIKSNKNISNNFIYNPNDKTIYRGIIHKIAFFIACIVTLATIIVMSVLRYFEWSVMLYCSVQIMQFGCSAMYHLYPVNNDVKKTLRNFDHMAIFFLISGTQTCCVQMLPRKVEGVKTSVFLSLTWALCAIGTLRVFLLKELDLYCILDLCIYLCQGLCILLFKNIFLCFYLFDLVLLFLGGAFYCVGAIIYGIEKPNPYPHVFGFHEIFHVCTLLGNGCFGIAILKSYFIKYYMINQ